MKVKHLIYLTFLCLGLTYNAHSQDKTYIPDYDNGDTIYINVKIAIDKRGWDEKTPEYFKTNLEEQWKKINYRFNHSDKKNQLTHHYHFEPDIDDIFVYDGPSYWGENGAHAKTIQYMDTNIFKLVVVYDFFFEGEENGERGGGCGNDNGIGTILVINGSEGMKNKFNNHFDQYTYRAITHELGHFRGLIDLYTLIVTPENDPFTHKGYIPTSCLMNDFTYEEDDKSYWSDYAIKIINKVGNEKRPGLIEHYLYTDFADNVEVNVTKNGKPVNGIIKFYPVSYSFRTWSNNVNPEPLYSFEESKVTLNARDTFFRDEEVLWKRVPIFLVEAEVDNRKQYEWITEQLVHDKGMDGVKTYTINFEF